MNDDEYWYAPTPWAIGHISTLPSEPENEAVRELHQAVAEVTGKAVEPPIKPRIGFLP